MRTSGLLIGVVLLFAGCQGTGGQQQSSLKGAGEEAGATRSTTDGDALTRGSDTPLSDKTPASSASQSSKGVLSRILEPVGVMVQIVGTIILAPFWLPFYLWDPPRC